MYTADQLVRSKMWAQGLRTNGDSESFVTIEEVKHDCGFI